MKIIKFINGKNSIKLINSMKFTKFYKAFTVCKDAVILLWILDLFEIVSNFEKLRNTAIIDNLNLQQKQWKP